MAFYSTCFNTILYVLYILYIVDLMKYSSSIWKILIVFLCYTSCVCFGLICFTPHSVVISLNLNPCNRVFIHMHICVVFWCYFQRHSLAMFALWSYDACRPYHWPITEHLSLLHYWIIYVWTVFWLLVKYTEILAFDTENKSFILAWGTRCFYGLSTRVIFVTILWVMHWNIARRCSFIFPFYF
jgi:hypothetical protein